MINKIIDLIKSKKNGIKDFVLFILMMQIMAYLLQLIGLLADKGIKWSFIEYILTIGVTLYLFLLYRFKKIEKPIAWYSWPTRILYGLVISLEYIIAIFIAFFRIKKGFRMTIVLCIGLFITRVLFSRATKELNNLYK